MIVIENFINFDGRKLKRTYSDKKLKIHKIGTDEIYDEAIDVLDSVYDYEETNEKAQELYVEENL